MKKLLSKCVSGRRLHSSHSSESSSSSSTTTLPVHAASFSSELSSSPETDTEGSDDLSTEEGSMDVDDQPTDLMETDFELFIGTSRFTCHKLVLFARWPHFAELVKQGHHSVSHGHLQFAENPLTAEIVGGLLRYWYTNEVEELPHTESFCLGILKSALLYEFVMPGDLSNQPVKGFELLLSYCRTALIKPLTIENSAPLLNTLFEYGSSTQQSRVVSFIARNLKQIMESPPAAKALATVSPALHSKILFSHFSMLQVLEDQ